MFNFSTNAWLITAALLIIPLIIFMIKMKVFTNYKPKSLLMAVNLSVAIQFIIGVLCWLVNFLPEQMDKPLNIPLLSEAAQCYFNFGLCIYLPLIVLINIILFKKTVRKYQKMREENEQLLK